MLRINEILLSVEALTQECFPELKAYRNLVHQGFQRPSFLTEVGKQTMEDADRWAVERTAQVKLTFFETVDAYHDSQIETLSDRLTLALALFSGGAVPVGDRYLDVGGAAGEVFNDYAELTFTLPPYQTAAGVTDMIAHIMERFFSGQPAAPVTDNIALGMIRAVIEAAPRVMEDPCDYDARADIMWVGTLAHNGLAGCGLGVPGGRDGDWTCHGLEHELSAFDTSITHGAGLAVIFPAWMRYVWREHPERFLEFGRQVFGIEPVDPAVDDLTGIDEEVTPERAVADAVEATIDELQDFFVSLGMPRTLSAFGMQEDDIEQLMPGLTINRGELFGSFKKLTLDDARAIYRSAL